MLTRRGEGGAGGSTDPVNISTCTCLSAPDHRPSPQHYITPIFAMATKKHAPSLYHPDLYRFGVPQDPSDLIASPDSWFAAVKLMRACIDQGCRDFSVLNDHISQLESKIATLKTENQDTKFENTDLLEKNTKANLAIVNLRSQVDRLSQDPSHLGKRHLSKKLPDPELYNGDKQKLRSWIHSLKMKLAGNSDHYPMYGIKQDPVFYWTP